uniref:Ycf23 n=1 Tax=Anunuuluaehu liula TaxID=3049639 RepID=UPI00300130B6
MINILSNWFNIISYIISYFIIMNLLHVKLKKIFSTKKAIKIIIVLDNFHINCILRLVKAEEIGKANYVDIAAYPEIVSAVKPLTCIPIYVSLIDLMDLYHCTLAGVDMLKIDNFNTFYNQGIVFSDYQILGSAEETQSLLTNSIICITISHILLLNQQIQLAFNLTNIGINFTQTKGLSTKNKILLITNNSILNSIHKASAALFSLYAIANSMNIPAIASSGINYISAPIFVAYNVFVFGIC